MLVFGKVCDLIARKRPVTTGGSGSFRTARPVVAGPMGVRSKCSHWLALAAMEVFFTRKSHAVLRARRNYLICLL
jgi:hypothetical protein